MNYFSSTNADGLTVVITLSSASCIQCSISWESKDVGRHVGFHAFRHGLASMLVDSAGAAGSATSTSSQRCGYYTGDLRAYNRVRPHGRDGSNSISITTDEQYFGRAGDC